jgi:hypothetical protein
MKTKLFLIPLVIALCADSSYGQGTFLFDQQSSDESLPGEAIIGIRPNQPLGQSFTPTLTSVGFIRLQLFDGDIIIGSGATLHIDLLTGSITGSLLASSDSVFLPNGFNGDFANFIFSTPVPVTAGTTYYFQPIIESGDGFLAGRFIPGVDYPGGTEFINGQPGSDDLWFREGIVVPEPSVLAVVLLAGMVVASHRARNKGSL